MKVARLLVEIDEDLKKDLKVRLIREGLTLKDWLSRMAEEYVAGRVSPGPAPVVAPRRTAVSNGVVSRRHDDYLD